VLVNLLGRLELSWQHPQRHLGHTAQVSFPEALSEVEGEHLAMDLLAHSNDFAQRLCHIRNLLSKSLRKSVSYSKGRYNSLPLPSSQQLSPAVALKQYAPLKKSQSLAPTGQLGKGNGCGPRLSWIRMGVWVAGIGTTVVQRGKATSRVVMPMFGRRWKRCELQVVEVRRTFGRDPRGLVCHDGQGRIRKDSSTGQAETF
jgi:hypothetical protein